MTGLEHGESPQVATPRSRERWYITARVAGRLARGGTAEDVPVETAHVKQLGTRRTACGLLTDRWVTFWERRAVDLPVGSCTTCAAVVREEIRG